MAKGSRPTAEYEKVKSLFRKASNAKDQLTRAETQLKAFRVAPGRTAREIKEAEKLVVDRRVIHENAEKEFMNAKNKFGAEKYDKIAARNREKKLAEMKRKANAN